MMQKQHGTVSSMPTYSECGRPAKLRIIQKRHYLIGQAVMALKLYGDLSSVQLAAFIGIKANGLKRALESCPLIDWRREPHEWHYENTGVKVNLTIKRDIVVFCLR